MLNQKKTTTKETIFILLIQYFEADIQPQTPVFRNSPVKYDIYIISQSVDMIPELMSLTEIL